MTCGDLHRVSVQVVVMQYDAMSHFKLVISLFISRYFLLLDLWHEQELDCVK